MGKISVFLFFRGHFASFWILNKRYMLSCVFVFMLWVSQCLLNIYERKNTTLKTFFSYNIDWCLKSFWLLWCYSSLWPPIFWFVFKFKCSWFIILYVQCCIVVSDVLFWFFYQLLIIKVSWGSYLQGFIFLPFTSSFEVHL